MDAARPSIWTSPIIQLLLRLPDLQLHHVAQYRWGAEAVKPTGLLTCWLGPFRFSRDLYKKASGDEMRRGQAQRNGYWERCQRRIQNGPAWAWIISRAVLFGSGFWAAPARFWMMGLYVLLSPVQLSVPAHGGHQTFRIVNSFCKPLQQGFDPLTHEMKKWCVPYFKKRGNKQSMNLPIYLSIHPSIHLLIFWSMSLSLYLSIYLSVFLSIHPSNPIQSNPIQSNPIQSIHLLYPSLSIHPSIHPSIYLSIFLSIYLSIFLSNQT